jgi:hypothetical protein
MPAIRSSVMRSNLRSTSPWWARVNFSCGTCWDLEQLAKADKEYAMADPKKPAPEIMPPAPRGNTAGQRRAGEASARDGWGGSYSFALYP